MRTWPIIARAIGTHGTCALVSVVKTEGSTPRETGARMVVTPEGFHGTIGGGSLEWKAMATAQAMLGKPRAVKIVRQSLGPDLGQCCGGRVELAIETFEVANLAEAEALAAKESEGYFEIEDRIPGVALAERFGETRRQVMVFGAGHVGRALVLALASLPFDVRWIDPRPEAFPGAMPSNVSATATHPAGEAVKAGPGSIVFIMSHSHALDFEIADAALRNSAIAHVGLIGSATKRARFERRLRQAGIEPSRVGELICPIGISQIRSKEPAAIAASVAAQLLVLHEALDAREQDRGGIANRAAR